MRPIFGLVRRDRAALHDPFHLIDRHTDVRQWIASDHYSA
jgi:hypothetical protein